MSIVGIGRLSIMELELLELRERNRYLEQQVFDLNLALMDAHQRISFLTEQLAQRELMRPPLYITQVPGNPLDPH